MAAFFVTSSWGNTGKNVGTHENVFRQVPVPEYYPWRWCPCPCPCPVLRLVRGHQRKAMFRLVPVPETEIEETVLL